MRNFKKKNIIRCLFFVIAFTVTIAVSVMCTGNNTLTQQVIKTSEDINKKCPIAVDDITTLDNTNVTEDPLTLVYLYSVDLDKDSIVGDFDEIKQNVIDNAQHMANTRPDMAIIRDNSILLKYHYKDKRGKDLFEFTITPEKTH